MIARLQWLVNINSKFSTTSCGNKPELDEVSFDCVPYRIDRSNLENETPTCTCIIVPSFFSTVEAAIIATQQLQIFTIIVLYILYAYAITMLAELHV